MTAKPKAPAAANQRARETVTLSAPITRGGRNHRTDLYRAQRIGAARVNLRNVMQGDFPACLLVALRVCDGADRGGFCRDARV
jgi:hypothetical protein